MRIEISGFRDEHRHEIERRLDFFKQNFGKGVEKQKKNLVMRLMSKVSPIKIDMFSAMSDWTYDATERKYSAFFSFPAEAFVGRRVFNEIKKAFNGEKDGIDTGIVVTELEAEDNK